MTRIAFTADLHVDGYGVRIDSMTGLNARLVDYLGTLTWVAAEAAQRGCETLVVAGDFTERRHPAAWLVGQIVAALDSFPFGKVLVRGNHDGELGGTSIVSVLGRQDDWHPVTRPGLVRAGDVVLACIPYLDRHWLRAQAGFETIADAEIYGLLAEQFLVIARGLYAEARRDHPDAGVVLVCHQAIAGAQMSETQQAFLGDVSLVVDGRALQAIGFEAVVAGHLHRHQVVLDRIGPTIGIRPPGAAGPVLYTGSIERVDFGEELETKGFVVADVGPGRFEWEFVPTPARPFVTLDCATAEEGWADSVVDEAIVRVINVPPEDDPADVRRALEQRGAFEIREIRRRPVDGPEIAGGLAETLTAEQALVEYFADDPEREPLVERGREILAEVAS